MKNNLSNERSAFANADTHRTKRAVLFIGLLGFFFRGGYRSMLLVVVS